MVTTKISLIFLIQLVVGTVGFAEIMSAQSAVSAMKMPAIMYGTAWKKEKTCDLVVAAVCAGFRGIDTACQPKHYHEPGVGEALQRLSSEHGIKREEIFLQTKFTPLRGQDPKNVPYDPSAPLKAQVQQSLAVSLRNLRTTYLDALLLHSPLDSHQRTMEVWREFEGFVRSGQVRQLGISNQYNLDEFQAIYRDAEIKPTVLQNRFYRDTHYDAGLRGMCRSQGIAYQSFWTLTANPNLLYSVEIQESAMELSASTEQVLFRFLQGEGIVPLTGTTSLPHMRDDLAAAALPLPSHRAAAIRRLLLAEPLDD